MTKCARCNQRKGKRTCPALGKICSACCGQHRRKDIDCPRDCAYLSPRGGLSLKSSLTDRIIKYAMNPGEWAKEAVKAFLGSETEMEEWETNSFFAYLAWGCTDENGDRAIDRFEREHKGDLSPSDGRVLQCLKNSWASLFEVVEVQDGVGLALLDRITGEEVFVHEKLGTQTMVEGDCLLGWIVLLGDHNELTGAVTSVPPAHVEAVEDAIMEAVDESEARTLDRITVSMTMAAAHRTLRTRGRIWKSTPPRLPDGSRLLLCKAVFEIKAPEAVRTRLLAHSDVEEVEPGRRYLWLAPAAPDPSDDRPMLGEIELRTVRLTLTTITQKLQEEGRRFLHDLLGTLVAHRVDSWKEPVTGESGHAPGAGQAPAGGDRPAAPAPVDGAVDTFSRSVRKKGGRREEKTQDGRFHNLPLLAHEVMYRRFPALKAAVDQLCRDWRAGQPDPVSTVSQAILEDLLEENDILEEHARAVHLSGYSREYAIADAELLGTHLFYALNHELHRRKTFWVDEGLAWMLAETDLDISGACLELPFPAFALVFLDPGTLDLAESLLSQVPDCPLSNEPVTILTMYITRITSAEPGVQGLNLNLLFDSRKDCWPYLLSRDLRIQEDDHLDAILDSSAPDVDPQERDPVFLLPELKKLVHIAINAILYATSAHLNPILLEPSSGRASGKRRKGRKKGRKAGKSISSEAVFHLPGKIRISQIRRYQKLRGLETGRRLYKRFMVRGHWRRANPAWKDQRIRWIEPFWKGPDVAAVIEKEYRLEP